jgi:hypothetical protein
MDKVQKYNSFNIIFNILSELIKSFCFVTLGDNRVVDCAVSVEEARSLRQKRPLKKR